MSAPEANINPRLAALVQAGTSPWLDQISRELVTSGELERLIAEDSLRGITANPAIFEKAFLSWGAYDEEFHRAEAEQLGTLAIYERLAMHDVGLAADALLGVYDSSGGQDGFASIEVAPELAHDADGTLAMVRDYWKRVARRNVMIKIPGTAEGVGAIEQSIYEGINVNVTLLFSVAAYERVVEAYLRGLERRLAEGKSLGVASVASFFVSRVDGAVDKQLEALGRSDLAGRAAVANARAAYSRFRELFSGPRWEALSSAGAAVQRPLWASTGVKNPDYPDTKYVDELVAPDTVNTMPMATLQAVADHGRVDEPGADAPFEEDLSALADVGIDLDAVTSQLLTDGIESFEEAMTRLLAGIDARHVELTGSEAQGSG